MFKIPDEFEINRSGPNKNANFIKLNEVLFEIRDFIYDLGFLTFGRDNILIHQIGAINGNQILDSASRTIESIRYCCLNGNFADAYSLLRKYRDDIFYYIYMLVVGEKTDIMQFLELNNLSVDEKNIYDWAKNQQSDVYIGVVFKAIATLPRANDVIKKFKLKDSFDKLATKLNNYTHSNGHSYYNFSYQRMDMTGSIKKNCEEFENAIIYITMSFLMVLIVISPGLIMAEDYIDYLDCGGNPPEGSQYWVAPFVSEFVSKHKGSVNTDELVHTARSSSACFPVFQCTLSAA